MDFKASFISLDVGGLLRSKADNISFSLKGLEEEKSKASIIKDKLSIVLMDLLLCFNMNGAKRIRLNQLNHRVFNQL